MEEKKEKPTNGNQFFGIQQFTRLEIVNIFAINDITK